MTTRDEGSLHGIRAKLIRARDQMEALDREINAFGDTNIGAGMPTQRDSDGLKWGKPLKLHLPIPLRWSVVIGEIMHDLRSALDHAVYQLTIDYTGSPLSRTQFPILSDPSKWESRGSKISPDNLAGFSRGCARFQIRGLGNGVVDYIERLQPYPAKRANSGVVQALHALHEIWNQDKHRLVHYWGILVRKDLVELNVIGTTSPYTVAFPDRIIHDGDDLVTVTFEQPPGQFQFDLPPAMQIAFQDPTKPLDVTGTSMWRIYDAANMIVSSLLVAVGNQDEPLP